MVAYEVAFARRLSSVQANDRFNYRWRVPEIKFDSRRKQIQLFELDKYCHRPVMDVSVNDSAEYFICGIPEFRLPLLLKWAAPVVGHVSGSNQYKVYNAHLIVGMACQRIPTYAPHFQILETVPRHQLSLSQACDLVLTVFGDFIANNRDLICRISSTADEASLLTGYSSSTTSEIRKMFGVINL
jgi:hypothetical protein